MNEKSVLRVSESCGAILRGGHFVYTSGRHGSAYINKDALYPHTDLTRTLTRAMAQRSAPYDIEIVAGPALGGIILSQWIAYHLSRMSNREILGVYSEKDREGNQVFRRGYDELLRGKRVLVVEDIVTTGGSVKQLADQGRAASGTVAAIAALVNRDPSPLTDAAFGAPFLPLLNFELESWDAAACPLCAAGIPINRSIGKGTARA